MKKTGGVVGESGSGCSRVGERVDVNKELKLLFVKMQKKSQDGRGVEGLVRGGDVNQE